MGIRWKFIKLLGRKMRNTGTGRERLPNCKDLDVCCLAEDRHVTRPSCIPAPVGRPRSLSQSLGLYTRALQLRMDRERNDVQAAAPNLGTVKEMHHALIG